MDQGRSSHKCGKLFNASLQGKHKETAAFVTQLAAAPALFGYILWKECIGGAAATSILPREHMLTCDVSINNSGDKVWWLLCKLDVRALNSTGLGSMR